MNRIGLLNFISLIAVTISSWLLARNYYKPVDYFHFGAATASQDTSETNYMTLASSSPAMGSYFYVYSHAPVPKKVLKVSGDFKTWEWAGTTEEVVEILIRERLRESARRSRVENSVFPYKREF